MRSAQACLGTPVGVQNVLVTYEWGSRPEVVVAPLADSTGSSKCMSTSALLAPSALVRVPLLQKLRVRLSVPSRPVCLYADDRRETGSSALYDSRTVSGEFERMTCSSAQSVLYCARSCFPRIRNRILPVALWNYGTFSCGLLRADASMPRSHMFERNSVRNSFGRICP